MKTGICEYVFLECYIGTYFTMKNDDINEYLPSILHPRNIKKFGDLSLTQNSISSRISLSLKKNNKCKENFVQSHKRNSSLNKNYNLNKDNVRQVIRNTKNLPTDKRIIQNDVTINKKTLDPSQIYVDRIENSAYLGISTVNKNILNEAEWSSTLSFDDLESCINNGEQKHNSNDKVAVQKCKDLNSLESNEQLYKKVNNVKTNDVLKEVNSLETKHTKSVVTNDKLSQWSINEGSQDLDKVVIYNFNGIITPISVSFGVTDCTSVKVCTKNVDIRNCLVSYSNNDTIFNCDLVVSSQTDDGGSNKSMNEPPLAASPKRSTVTVSLEVTELSDDTESSRVLILKSNAIEKVSYVIVQPPNYKLAKPQILDKIKLKRKCTSPGPSIRNGKSCRISLKLIDKYFVGSSQSSDVLNIAVSNARTLAHNLSGKLLNDQNVTVDMNKNSGAEIGKSEYVKGGHQKVRRDELSPRPYIVPSVRREHGSPKFQELRTSGSDAPRVPSPGLRNGSASSYSPRKNTDSQQFSIQKLNKSSVTSSRVIPHYKIVAGTHFAVDAFSYGEIANVKNYFLTHFHSDHYSGLKKTFNKNLYCSQITADLCISRLGVSPKCIHILKLDETIVIDGIEVMAVDANHCPGAVMLVFTLPNGKTLLHTGDFRATPQMESYPIFWNKDLHTIYLDTTYCNPRYNFPTQDMSLEMALSYLKQKKSALENAGKKFSSVLIVCGTYTIGKEKFFLGMARRVGCTVWACPEKDRVLQIVEGRSFCRSPPQACQLHVMPMRDLTHEKLRSYLDSMQGAFSEVVAFKPSGWENGKNSTVEKDLVTIHGIPYSEHSSFSEMIRFVKYLSPKQVVPTVDISGGIKSVQVHFPCPLVYKEDVPAVT